MGQDDKPSHVERPGAHLQCLLLSAEAVGTVLRTWHHHRYPVGPGSPGQDVHHRFGIAGAQGQCTVEAAEELLVALLAVTADDEERTGIAADDGERLAVVERHQRPGITAETRPGGLQGQLGTGGSLEMEMIGSRGSTAWPVVEYQQVGMQKQQTVNLAVVAPDALRLVMARHHRKVHGQHGEGVHHDTETGVDATGKLLLGSVLLAEEAGTPGHRPAVGVSLGGDDAVGIELCSEGDDPAVEVTRLQMTEVPIALSHLGPLLELLVEEVSQPTIVGLRSLFVLRAASQKFQGAQPVLEGCAGEALAVIGLASDIPLPAAPQVETVVETRHAPAPADGQSLGIVFTIADIGEGNVAEQWCEKGARGPYAVHAKQRVGTLLRGPFAVPHHAIRERTELSVTIAISSHHHGGVGGMKGVDYRLEHRG